MPDERRITRRGAIGVMATPLLSPLLAACASGSRRGESSAALVVMSLVPYAGLLERDAAATLDAVRETGVEHVELPSLFVPGSAAARLRAEARRAGVVLDSARVSGGRLYRGWQRTLDLARALGCRALTCATPAPDERPSARDWAELGAALARAGETAARAGVMLRALVDEAWLATPTIADPLGAVLEASAGAPFGFVVSAGGVTAAPSPLTELVQRAGRRVAAVVVEGEAGAVASAATTARSVGTREWIVSVPHAARLVPVERVRASVANVRTMLAGVRAGA